VEGFKMQKFLSDTYISFWILPPQIPLGTTGDWTKDYKLPRRRQSSRALASFCLVIPGYYVGWSFNCVQTNLINPGRYF